MVVLMKPVLRVEVVKYSVFWLEYFLGDRTPLSKVFGMFFVLFFLRMLR